MALDAHTVQQNVGNLRMKVEIRPFTGFAKLSDDLRGLRVD